MFSFLIPDMADLVDLKSEKGQILLTETFQKKKYNQPFLQGIFSKQIGRRNCGIQSCALLMGAAQLGKTLPNVCLPGKRFDPPIAEAKMFEYKETLGVTNQDIVAKEGLSLDTLDAILKAHGLKVDTYFADRSRVEEFRNLAKKALEKGSSDMGVIVNYDMVNLGQGDHLGGHHSPLAAYHEETDRFLIMDTWPDTEECWATTESLFRAMDTEDKSTKKRRGFCIVNIQ